MLTVWCVLFYRPRLVFLCFFIPISNFALTCNSLMKMNTNTSCYATVDYQRWPLPAHYHHHPDEYLPPADPFDGKSSYRTAYLGPVAPVRASMKPPNNPVESEAMLDDLTTSRAAYIRHPICPPPIHQMQEYLPNPAIMDGLTNYRKDYIMKGDGKVRRTFVFVFFCEGIYQRLVGVVKRQASDIDF